MLCVRGVVCEGCSVCFVRGVVCAVCEGCAVCCV